VILYYALGGGLGHLTRARKVLAALELDAVILTASRFGGDARVIGPHRALKVPRRLGREREAFRAWLAPVLREAEQLIVDTFPGGVLGELCGLTLPPATLIARRLRWEAYETVLDGPLPAYERVYEVEPLGVGEPLELPRAAVGAPLADEPHWLVVHSGPQHELDTLIACASRAPKLIVVSPLALDVYPVEPHLAHAERIVSGAGFNIVHEAAPYRARHDLHPFPRRFDDQFARRDGAGSAPLIERGGGETRSGHESNQWRS
jgi:hypothetical protein